jgi:hypothetical protein
MNRDEQFDFLVQRLRPDIELPATPDEKWRLFRSLVNVREPVPVDDDFLAVQDELLQSLIAEIIIYRRRFSDINQRTKQTPFFVRCCRKLYIRPKPLYQKIKLFVSIHLFPRLILLDILHPIYTLRHGLV